MPLLQWPVPLKLGSRADRFHGARKIWERRWKEFLLVIWGSNARRKSRKHLQSTFPSNKRLGLSDVPPRSSVSGQAYREERLARDAQVSALSKLGMSQTAIAKRVGMGQSTVGNWLAAGAYPETTRGPYVSRLDPYLP